MQIDFAMNIYAACEAARVLKGKMWGSAWNVGAAACLPFAWNNNWNIYNLPMDEMPTGRGYSWHGWAARGSQGGTPGSGRACPAADLECAQHPCAMHSPARNPGKTRKMKAGAISFSEGCKSARKWLLFHRHCRY